MLQNMDVASEDLGGHEGLGSMPPKFLAYLVILCFDKRRPKQKYCCSPKVNHFPPKVFRLATPLLQNPLQLAPAVIVTRPDEGGEQVGKLHSEFQKALTNPCFRKKVQRWLISCCAVRRFEPQNTVNKILADFCR